MIIDNCMSLITDWIETFLLLSVALKPGANSDIKLGQAPSSRPTINLSKNPSSGFMPIYTFIIIHTHVHTYTLTHYHTHTHTHTHA